MSPVTVVDLVFTQSLIREIHAQIESAPASPVFGGVVGTVFEDPTCARRWARLERAVTSTTPVDEDAPGEALADAMGRLAAGLDGETLLGWYRTHHTAGLYLAPEEARFHEEAFPAAWGFGMILAGTGNRLAGSVFQRTDPEGLSRSVYTPFYELVETAPATANASRQTCISWANYQTDARVVRPDETDTPVTVATIPELAEPIAATPAPSIADEAEVTPVRKQRMKPAVDGLPFLESEPAAAPDPAPVRSEESEADRRSAEQHEAEWEKIQIQRSLTAVGRSLGPGTIGTLGAPAPETAAEGTDSSERAESTPRPEPDSELARPPLAVVGEEDPTEPGASEEAEPERPKVIPISTGSTAPVGLVGGARRRSRIPVAKIAMGAAGVVLLLSAGWVGTHSLGGDGSNGESVASVSLTPGQLFGDDDNTGTDPSDDTSNDASEQPGESDGAAPLPADQANDEAGEESGASTPANGAAREEETGDIGGLAPLEVVVDPDAEYVSTQADGTYTGPGSPPLPSPEPPQVVEAPALDSFVVMDPSESAYETALSIFKTEIDRYEETRREYDDGISTCNPLNLAYRGVLDSNERLVRRYTDVQSSMTGPARRAHEAAQRQFVVAKTHYELTDCPMPIGG